MTLFLALGIALLALLTSLATLWRARTAFINVWNALEPLASEHQHIELKRAEIENELDARLKRLISREVYWREQATRLQGASADTGQAESVSRVEAAPVAESPLSLRDRLQRRG